MEYMMNKCVFTLMSYRERMGQHQDLLELDRLYKEENGTSFFDMDENIENQYLVCHHDTYGIIGAAKISPPKSTKPVLNNYFKQNDYELRDFWQVSHIMFVLSSDCDFDEDSDIFEKICKTFYKELSKTLALIGLERDVQTWVVLNGLEDHEDTKYFGNWPYSIEHSLLPENNLVFGCLENKKLISIR